MGWKRGDVVMTSEPYAHVLLNMYRKSRCNFCFKRDKEAKQCSKCQVLKYCSRECQKEDWSVHKVECKCLQQVAPQIPSDSVMLILRLVIKFLQGKHLKNMEKDPGLRTFDQLMSHDEDVIGDDNRCDAFGKICFTLSKLACDQLPLPNMKDLLDIFGKMAINTFTIADEELRDVGSGVYLSPSILDHRCTPNAVVTFRGTKLYVRAIDDIPDGDITQVSQQVFLTYVDQLAPSSERQEQLGLQYYFRCKCPRCNNPDLDKLMTSGVSSSVEGSGDAQGQIEVANKTCQTTITKVDALKKVEGKEEEILSACQSCLSKVKEVLNPSNVYLIRVLDRAFDAAIAQSQWEEALEFAVQTLQPYRELLPPYSPSLGLQLMRVGKLQLWLDQPLRAMNTLRQADAIISVTHGRDSELFSHLQEHQWEASLDLNQAAIQQ